MLFHGTDSEEVARGICYQNFDPRMHGKNATVYGKGAYFARDASYSHNYTASRGKRYMFLADVLVGDYTKGDNTMQRPPKKPGLKQHELFDSTVDDVNNPTIFVIYAMEKCYPSYLILYKEQGENVNWSTYHPGYPRGLDPRFGTLASGKGTSLSSSSFSSQKGGIPQTSTTQAPSVGTSSSTSSSSQKGKCLIQ